MATPSRGTTGGKTLYQAAVQKEARQEMTSIDLDHIESVYTPKTQGSPNGLPCTFTAADVPISAVKDAHEIEWRPELWIKPKQAD